MPEQVFHNYSKLSFLIAPSEKRLWLGGFGWGSQGLYESGVIRGLSFTSYQKPKAFGFRAG